MSETSNEWTGPTLLDLMSYVEDTHVSPSASPVRVKAKKTRAISGHGYEKPYAFYDPVTQSLKMYVATCPLAALPSLEKLPPSGIAQNGVLFLRPPWEPITDATESSSWPTPTAVTRPMEGNVRLYRAKIEAGEMTEEEATQILGKSPFEAQGKIPAMWPTPRASAAMSENLDNVRKRVERRGRLGAKLEESVALWPTPLASDSHYRLQGSSQAANNLQAMARRGELSPETGKLNPTWVEWLMGFPIGWTDLKDSETPSSPK